MNARGQLGRSGEHAAVEYLRQHGFRIVETNHRSPLGEVDIIGQEGDTLVFVEVKSRSDSGYAQPYESVGVRKRDRIRRLALQYLSSIPGPDRAVRFDVVSVVVGPDALRVEHIRDAF
jgi:putative endonuclease